ncbi:NAD-dependent epimerase/dehydratase family protein [Mucilaginibacter segetis]|uniref:NAD(P)-dependent oxidoreductase n=1 Tax=Mucilaginibacter segetis TaxID=2793071 RepID=A0A934PSF2_9SPHI|nr:NAD(P)-dependent oxidoreductase [Mucilaginibacter segetis]MBK0378766.1 NAD(P)-dependent oxidoreductase [Mucilaginibacter segetis]
MKDRVLITGASGFVGYHLIEEALKNNLEVYAAVRKSSRIEHLKNLDIQYTYPAFNDIAALTREIKEKKYDYIIHAAGATKARSASEYNLINATYTFNLAKAAEEAGVKKFVFISSLATIGALKSINGLITDNTAPAPFTAYGKSKLLAEEKLKSLTKLNYTILRPTAVYGPRDTDIFIFLKQIAKGIEPYIGNIQQKLSFVFVKDLAVVSVKALFAPEKSTYNISDGNFYDRYEMADITKFLLKSKTIKFHLPVNFVKIVAAIAGNISSLRGKAAVVNLEKISELIAVNWHCDIERAKSELGFYPQYNLKAGLTDTIQWYKENKWLK